MPLVKINKKRQEKRSRYEPKRPAAMHVANLSAIGHLAQMRFGESIQPGPIAHISRDTACRVPTKTIVGVTINCDTQISLLD